MQSNGNAIKSQRNNATLSSYHFISLYWQHFLDILLLCSNKYVSLENVHDKIFDMALGSKPYNAEVL